MTQTLADPKDLVRRLVDRGQNRGELDVIDEVLAPNFVDHSPLSGLSADREGVRILFGALREAFPDLRVTILRQVAEAGLVATHKLFEGTHRGPFLGIPPSGGAIRFEVADYLQVRDGLITDHWVVADMLTLMRQLGAIPA